MMCRAVWNRQDHTKGNTALDNEKRCGLAASISDQGNYLSLSELIHHRNVYFWMEQQLYVIINKYHLQEDKL